MNSSVIGRIVKSGAGRDKDKFMVVCNIDGEFVYLVDGKERKLEKPKKKRLKHIYPTNTVIDMQNITDKKLRCIIAEYTAKRTIEKL